MTGEPVTFMAFVDQRTRQPVWQTPSFGDWQPVPRVGDHVRYERGPQVWRVTQVLHVWGPGMTAAGKSRCYSIEVTIAPAYEEDGGERS